MFCDEKRRSREAIPTAVKWCSGRMSHAFIDHFQQVARPHFVVHGLERRSRS